MAILKKRRNSLYARRVSQVNPTKKEKTKLKSKSKLLEDRDLSILTQKNSDLIAAGSLGSVAKENIGWLVLMNVWGEHLHPGSFSGLSCRKCTANCPHHVTCFGTATPTFAVPNISPASAEESTTNLQNPT